MTTYDFIQFLETIHYIDFRLPNGYPIPAHYHITEVASIDKRYIDCGGQKRHEQYNTMQIRVANDIDHRLPAKKLLQIIETNCDSKNLNNPLLFEYQGETIQSWGWNIQRNIVYLQPTYTNCLAQDACGIKQQQ